MLFLVKFQAISCNFTKSNTPHWVFTKSRNASHLLIVLCRSLKSFHLDKIYGENFNALTTNVPIIKKPVSWFALQIGWLVSI